jgi:hypothetical protein
MTMVLMDVFMKGDVYIDYPPEDVKFRFEHATRKVYRRFYGAPEDEDPAQLEPLPRGHFGGKADHPRRLLQ